jgi:hypothetical protein
MGTDALMQTLNPKRKRADERVMQRTVRLKVAEALRKLAQLGFVELVDAEQLRLWPSLMRFAEPVRGLDAPSEALKRLIERGEVSLGPGDDEPAETEADAGADADLDAGADVDGEATIQPAAAVAAAAAIGTDFASDSLAASGSEALAWIDDELGSAADDTSETEGEPHEQAEPEADAEAWAEVAALGDFDAEVDAAAPGAFEAEAEAGAAAEAGAEAETSGDLDAEAEAEALREFQAEAEAAALGQLDADAEPPAQGGFELEPSVDGAAEPAFEVASEELPPAFPAPDAPAAEEDATVVSSPADLDIEWDTLPGEKA